MIIIMQLPECMFSLRAKYLYDYIGFTVFTFTSTHYIHLWWSKNPRSDWPTDIGPANNLDFVLNIKQLSPKVR